jgi:malonyl CoA-acyl carrier protein transacylase
MNRALLVFPGRGSYSAPELGTLGRIAESSSDARAVVAEVAAAIDAPRARRGLPSVLELDAAAKLDPALHLAGENASALIVACGLVDARLVERGGALAPCGFVGNSLGFYTALAAAGSLSLADVATLIDEVTALQKERGRGGQTIYPLVDDKTWLRDVAKEVQIELALAEVPGARLSVELGAFAVLAGDDTSLDRLDALLPRVLHGGREYPVRLKGHLAFHTELLAPVAESARERLAGLAWRAPRAHVVTGTAEVVSPWSCDTAALAAYTLGPQITTTFRLATALRVGLRELAPELVVLAGPGESIGGAIGAAIAADGWRGIRSKDEFTARQKTDPVVLSLGRADQRLRALQATVRA